MGQCYIFQNQRHIADRACANFCTLQATEGQHLLFASLSYLPLPVSARCLCVVSTFASIFALPPSHIYLCQHLRVASLSYLPLPASSRCLPLTSTFASIFALPPSHIYLCQHLRVSSLSYLPLSASSRCLPLASTFASIFVFPPSHIYLCQHLRAASLCHIYLYSILIVKALKIAADGTISCFRCTIRSACQKASQSSPRWLSLGTGQQCIDFEQVLPDRIPINQMTTVRQTFTLPVFIWGICV